MPKFKMYLFELHIKFPVHKNVYKSVFRSNKTLFSNASNKNKNKSIET